jgi:NAD(P)-dependent dehydrogenase (short-subunit alcohol dehydrogenase family)
MTDLTGRVAFVAGAGGGMGQAIASLFAARGADVFVSARTSEKAQRAADQAGPRAIPVLLDVTNRASWDAAVAPVRERFGMLHILVNATGVSYGNTIENGTEEDLRKHMLVNVEGVFLGCQIALPLLKLAEGKGSIVNIGSVIAARPYAGLMAYGASKGAMASLSKSIALHCARTGLGIRVNVIHPGGIQTEIFEQGLADTGLPREEAYAMWRATHPIGRIGTPEEVAQAALWLASDASSFTTGTEIYVDGAASIG